MNWFLSSFKSFSRTWHNQLKTCKTSLVCFSRILLQALRDFLSSAASCRPRKGILYSKPLTNFSNATSHRAAFVSAGGIFSRSLPVPLPGCTAIVFHRQISRNLLLVSDNLPVLYALRKGSSRSASQNFLIQNLAHFHLKRPFYLC